jgi:hypothetical protein
MRKGQINKFDDGVVEKRWTKHVNWLDMKVSHFLLLSFFSVASFPLFGNIFQDVSEPH